MTATPTRNSYDRLAAGNVPGALALMAAEMEWITMWNHLLKERGLDRVDESLFKPLTAEWTSFLLKSTEFITQGETAVSLGDFKPAHSATGKTCDARYTPDWSLMDSKITTSGKYIDTSLVAQARV